MEQMRKHIKEIHLSARRVALGVTPSKAKEIEEAKAKQEEKNNPTVPQATPIAPTIEKPQRKPIILTYSFTGDCPIDNLPIKTIPINAGGGLYMIAWCDNCNKQYQSIKVIPIERMEQKLIEDDAEFEAIEESKGVWPINKFRKK